MGTRKTQFSASRKWRESLIGLTLRWKDETPYDYPPDKDLIIVDATHANPTKKIIICREWKNNKDGVTLSIRPKRIKFSKRREVSAFMLQSCFS